MHLAGDSAGNVLALCVLYSISASGDLPNSPSFTYFQYGMNECVKHDCVYLPLSVVAVSLFPRLCLLPPCLSLGVSS